MEYGNGCLSTKPKLSSEFVEVQAGVMVRVGHLFLDPHLPPLDLKHPQVLLETWPWWGQRFMLGV